MNCYGSRPGAADPPSAIPLTRPRLGVRGGPPEATGGSARRGRPPQGPAGTDPLADWGQVVPPQVEAQPYDGSWDAIRRTGRCACRVRYPAHQHSPARS